MSIGSRQMHIGSASVPPIKYEDKPDIKGYETIVEVFTEALMKKQCHDYRDDYHTAEDKKKYPHIQEGIDAERKKYKDYLSQTIDFLKKIGALKKAEKITSIELWRDFINTTPFYEGISVQLRSTLIEKHYPSVYKALKKGATYGYQPLTDMAEAITYIMEYFTKEKLLNDVAEVFKGDFVKKWVDNHIKYCSDHKEEIEKESKAQEDYRKEEFKRVDVAMDKLLTKEV